MVESARCETSGKTSCKTSALVGLGLCGAITSDLAATGDGSGWSMGLVTVSTGLLGSEGAGRGLRKVSSGALLAEAGSAVDLGSGAFCATGLSDRAGEDGGVEEFCAIASLVFSGLALLRKPRTAAKMRIAATPIPAA